MIVHRQLPNFERRPPRGVSTCRHEEVVDPTTAADWNESIAGLPGVTAFHSAEWARVLSDCYGFRPFYCVEGGLDQPRSLLPLMEVDSPVTGRRGVSLPLTDYCGIAGHLPGALARLLPHARDLAASRNWRYMELRDPSGDGSPEDGVGGYYTHRLRLGDENAMWMRMSPATRRAVRAGLRSGIRVDASCDDRALNDLYSLLCVTRRRLGVPPQPLRFFRKLKTHVLDRGRGVLHVAYHQGRPVAGALHLVFGKHAIYKYGASDPSAVSLRPNNRLIWEAMTRFAELGFEELHLGRCDEDGDGLRRYKLGWGALEERLAYRRTCAVGRSWHGSGRPRFSWSRALMRRTPIPIARWIGAVAYPHMA